MCDEIKSYLEQKGYSKTEAAGLARNAEHQIEVDRAKKKKELARIEYLRDALSENGIVVFYKMDQHLVTELCDIIGSLHRLCETKGVTPAEIETWVGVSAVV